MNDHAAGPGAVAGEEYNHLGDGLGGRSDASTKSQMAGTAATPRDRQSFACPNCGHELSMYMEPSGASRAENLAARLADFFGSWLFLLSLAVVIIAWLAVNLVIGLLDPGPSAVLSHLDIALAIVAVMQGPLILLTQRREAERDRARDIEIFHVTVNTEQDVHALRTAIEQRIPGMRTSVETVQPGEAP